MLVAVVAVDVALAGDVTVGVGMIASRPISRHDRVNLTAAEIVQTRQPRVN